MTSSKYNLIYALYRKGYTYDEMVTMSKLSLIEVMDICQNIYANDDGDMKAIKRRGEKPNVLSEVRDGKDDSSRYSFRRGINVSPKKV